MTVRRPAVAAGRRTRSGEVYLVGAGPGDPDLLTVRALKLMKRADVALYDNLISPEVLALLPARVERIYVGKRRAEPHDAAGGDQRAARGAGAGRQARAAPQGRRPVRLRPRRRGNRHAGEHGIPFEVVPGITAALGAAAYAGIPLTHRDYAQSCVFVTGHLKDGTHGPRLARARAGAADDRRLHGIARPAAALPQARRARIVPRHGRRGRPAGNDTDPARDHRDARDTARPGSRRRSCTRRR